MPTFQWSSVSGASAYNLTVIDQTAGQSLISTFPITGTSFTGLAFNNGDNYRWYVAARNSAGTVGTAAAGTFTVSAPPLGSSTPISPAADSIVNTTTPTLQWSAVSGATSYLVAPVDTAAQGASFIPSATGTSYTPTTPLLNGHTYRWSVTAVFTINGVAVVGPQSATLEFTVSVPGTPTLIGPSGTVNTHTPVFQWSAVSGAAGYSLTLKDTTSNKNVINQQPISGTSYTPSMPLVNGDSYQWYVQAYDTVGDLGLAPQPFAFTISVSVAAPTLGTPLGTVTTTTPTFQWAAVSGAAGYSLYVTDTTTNTPVFNGLPLSVTSYTPGTPLVNGDSFEWWVTASNSSGDTSPPPQALPFSVSAPTIGTPILTSPTGITSTTLPMFQWSVATGAAGYDFTLIDTTTSVYVIPLVPVSGPSYTLSAPLVTGDSYQWYVQAYDSTQQQTIKSNVLQFTTSAISFTASAISGVVFQDPNLNGIQDGGEPGLANQVVFLDLNNDGVLDAGDPSATTDSSGAYSFSGLVPGSYTVRQVLLGGVLLSTPASGSLSVTLAGGVNLTGQNFADVPTSITVPLTLPLTIPFPSQGNANADFVEATYRAVLNRNGEAGGVAFWSGQLVSGAATRLQVVQGIRNSPEHFGQEVDTFYLTLLSRPSDAVGRAYWVSQLENGVREEQMAFAFLDSPEYLSKGDKFFIDSMYQSLLGRAFDPAGEGSWLNQLGDDATGSPTHAAALEPHTGDQRLPVLHGVVDRIGRGVLRSVLAAGGGRGGTELLGGPTRTGVAVLDHRTGVRGFR